MGRINFGQQNADRKGIHAPVKLDGVALSDWKIYNLPLDEKMLAHLQFKKAGSTSGSEAPAFWRAILKVKTPGDTFLDMRPWGKGVVWVNGHCLGRYWDIGPTQTMYLPGPWLKHGRNEVIILDLTGPENPMIGSLDHPILNEIHPEKDFAGQ